MGSLIDAFSKEDRVNVTFSNFYALMKGCAERDILTNGIKCNVPHRYMREMISGKSEEVQEDEKNMEESGDKRLTLIGVDFGGCSLSEVDKQRLMLDGMDKLLRRFNKYPDDKEFTVEEIIKASNEVYHEILKQEN